MRASIFTLALQGLGVGGLEVLTTRRLDIDKSGVGVATWSTVAKIPIRGKGRFSVFHG